MHKSEISEAEDALELLREKVWNTVGEFGHYQNVRFSVRLPVSVATWWRERQTYQQRLNEAILQGVANTRENRQDGIFPTEPNFWRDTKAGAGVVKHGGRMLAGALTVGAVGTGGYFVVTADKGPLYLMGALAGILAVMAIYSVGAWVIERIENWK